MNIKQCQFCKKPFASLGGKICPDCLEQIDKDFIKVRDYVYEQKHHPGIDEIAEETEVSKQIIVHLIKEGRLILDNPDGAGGLIVCEVCKKPIKTGRICEKCKGKLDGAAEKMASAPAPKKPDTNFRGSAKIR